MVDNSSNSKAYIATVRCISFVHFILVWSTIKISESFMFGSCVANSQIRGGELTTRNTSALCKGNFCRWPYFRTILTLVGIHLEKFICCRLKLQLFMSITFLPPSLFATNYFLLLFVIISQLLPSKAKIALNDF